MTLKDREAAEFLGMSLTWLRHSRMDGTGPVYLKIGRSVRYRTEDLEAWLLKHQRQNTIKGGR